MSLNLHLLRLFATVARTGSFSRAAEVLRISQPAISKGVRDFELQVGCRLLDRNSKGVRPTREGQALARHADALFAAERAAEWYIPIDGWFRDVEGTGWGTNIPSGRIYAAIGTVLDSIFFRLGQ